MSQLQSESASSSSSGVDHALLCLEIVQRIRGVVSSGKILNKRQCIILADYLSEVVCWVRNLHKIEQAAATPILAALHRYFEKAEVLVKQCAEEDWCAAAVFQCSNDMSILNVGRCIYSVAEVFFSWGIPAIRLHRMAMDKYDVNEDREDLRKRLEGLAREQSSSSIWIFKRQSALEQRRAQHLARYLLKKNEFQLEHTTTDNSLESLKSIMWEKDDEPTGTWGENKFLGAGSGASGVLETSWLDVPCAKKVFLGDECESMFMKEAFIMARLKKHPCLVNFICCGNGKRKGDRFIAMELMEKSLYDLIKERKGVHFSLEVALDIIWQIADRVNFLHEQGVAHRDLKSQNVLVKTLSSSYNEDYYCVKLADFGTCKSEVEVSKSNTMTYRGIGTTRYRAPEAFPNAHPQGLGKVDWMRADAYSFAMTCAHVLTLKQPFEDMDMSKLYNELLDGQRPSLSKSSTCSEELIELVEECWSTERSRRPKFHTILSKLIVMLSKNLRVMFSKNLRVTDFVRHGVMYVDECGVILRRSDLHLRVQFDAAAEAAKVLHYRMEEATAEAAEAAKILHHRMQEAAAVASNSKLY